MKKFKLGCLLLSAAMMFSMAGCGEAEEVDKNVEIYGQTPEKSEYVLENEYLKFVMDSETTQFSVEDKRSGKIWYSNPQDLESDSLANISAKEMLKSPLLMQYSNEAAVTNTYNVSAHSILNGLYEIEETEKGVKVKYSIGNIERTYIFPAAAPEARIREFYDQLDRKTQKKIDECYRKYSLDKLRVDDDKDALLAAYPDLAETTVWVLRDNVKQYLKENLEKYFTSVGYTQEDYEIDFARYSTETSTDKPVFDISVEYYLDGADFIAKIPMEEIDFKPEYPLTQVKLLPYFGAGSVNDEGYIIVPDGNGAVINFNNGKANQNIYYSNMYGWDYGLPRDAVVNETDSRFPMLAISRNGTSVICMLEEGSSYASMEADVAGRLHGYNYATAAYTMIHGSSMDVSSKSDKEVIIYQDNLPKENIVQRYRFVDTADYSDIAVAYRDYLMNKYPTLTKNTDTSVPVMVKMVGAIERVRNRLGFPVTVSEELTTYEEAAAMLDELSAKIPNLSMSYAGWFNDGLYHDAATDVDLISELGGKSKFKKLTALAKEKGVDLFLESYVEFVYNNSFFNGFMRNRDAARFLTKEVNELYDYDPIWFGPMDDDDSTLRYMVKNSFTNKMIDTVNDAVRKYEAAGLSFADMGYMLGGDYYYKALVTREEMIKLQQQKLAETKDAGTKISIYKGNEYAIPYADTVVDMKLSNDQYGIEDYSIPFFSIVLHGLVDYTGQAINLSNDYQTTILQSAEAGAGLFFTFMDAETAQVQETKYTFLYGAEYDLWKDQAMQIYEQYNKDFGNVFNQYIVDHKYIADGVAMTQYEDGTKVYVNYNYNDCTADGVNVAARSYLVQKGGN